MAAMRRLASVAVACLALTLAATSLVHGARVPSDTAHAQIRATSSGIKYTPEALADRVHYLPGWGDLGPISMFAG